MCLLQGACERDACAHVFSLLDVLTLLISNVACSPCKVLQACVLEPTLSLTFDAAHCSRSQSPVRISRRSPQCISLCRVAGGNGFTRPSLCLHGAASKRARLLARHRRRREMRHVLSAQFRVSPIRWIWGGGSSCGTELLICRSVWHQ